MYSILALSATKDVLNLSSVSRRFHALALRIYHNRLTVAAALTEHTLLLECYHPSARLTAPPLFCTSKGTQGLEDALEHGGDTPLGKIAYLESLYTRFNPQRQEPERTAVRRARAGDIPGSRTHPSSSRQETNSSSTGLSVSETVSLEAHELFSQLCCVTNMVTLGPRRGLFTSRVEVSDGTIRVFRNWLAKEVNAPTLRDEPLEPSKDRSILWVNTLDNLVGIKFRVRTRKRQQDNPILYASDEEVAVSYDIDYEGHWNSNEHRFDPALTVSRNVNQDVVPVTKD